MPTNWRGSGGGGLGGLGRGGGRFVLIVTSPPSGMVWGV